MQKGQIVIWIIVGSLIIAVAGGAYYLGRFTSPKPSAPPVVTSQPPKPTPNETANWKTKSIKLLSFKYPSNWEEIHDQVTGGYLSFKLTNKKVGFSVNEYTYINQTDTPEHLAQQALGNEIPVNKKQIMIDGHRAIYQERHYPTNVSIEVYIGDIKDITHFLPQDGGDRLTTGTHFVAMEIGDLVLLDESRKTFDQILSTFKFTQ